MRFAYSVFASLIASSFALSADWRPIATDLIEKEKPGYGGLSGVLVDRATGAIYVDLSDRGIFRSTDQGKTWERIGKDAIKGRTEVPGCFMMDPTGKSKRLLLPVVYGSPIAVGSVAGDWKILDKASVHVDWCAADWSDPEMKFLLTLKHESGGLLLMSRDSGKSFTEVGKGYGPAWVFDKDTAVVAKMKSKDNPDGGIVLTTDGGKTFKHAGNFSFVSLPRWYGNTLWWRDEYGIIYRTSNKCQTWYRLRDVKDTRYGPVIGKDEKQLFVLTGTGVVESTDGGETWGVPVAVPKELKGVSALTWLEYDPKNDVVYVMKMGSDLYAMNRGK